jgi:UDP-N-acetylmuramate dehydrogenase
VVSVQVFSLECEYETVSYPDSGVPDRGILRDEPLARYTSARLGGPADYLITVETTEALIGFVRWARDKGLIWCVLGSGSNVLVADAGFRGLVIINKARRVTIGHEGRVYAEAGANLSSLARSCINRGLAGLEWAVSVPGTVGGAVVGNAGAHGGDVAGNLESATVLDPSGTVSEWSVDRLGFEYRDSVIKRRAHSAPLVVISATFLLMPSDPTELVGRADEFAERRKATQPPGASIGSMFKNPPGDFAGRLIDSVGLKGKQVGGAQISPVHANFFVNTGSATADDVKSLIDLARVAVQKRFGVELELEIELLGEWHHAATGDTISSL